jgi:predicted glycoside hydrolase/deacetylase ChbG (UPF0249 family)
MIIINADDWGRSVLETDAALACYQAGRITSASAMVFMADSGRAADVARKTNLDVGLHVNLNEKFSAPNVPAELSGHLESIARFLDRGKFALILYNPFLRNAFRLLYRAQESEFVRLYGRSPSHVDGHRHLHLCTNMLLDGPIPRGSQVRRSFTFFRGEKGPLNRGYRSLVDRWLKRRYRMTDHFFCLRQSLQAGKLARIVAMSKSARIELMTHPYNKFESEFLMSGDFVALFSGAELSSFSKNRPIRSGV